MKFDEILKLKGLKLNQTYRLSEDKSITKISDIQEGDFYFNINQMGAVVFCFICSDDLEDFLTVRTPYIITDETAEDIKKNISQAIDKIKTTDENIQQIEEHAKKFNSQTMQMIENQRVKDLGFQSFKLTPFVNEKIEILSDSFANFDMAISLLNSANYGNLAQIKLLEILEIIL